jgi:hypothetical protein
MGSATIHEITRSIRLALRIVQGKGLPEGPSGAHGSGRLLQPGKLRREFDLIARRLVEEDEAAKASHATCDQIAEISVCRGIFLIRPCEGLHNFNGHASAVAGGQERPGFDIRRIVRAKTVAGFQAGHDDDIRPFGQAIVGAGTVIQVVQENDGGVTGIDLLHTDPGQSALDGVRVPGTGGCSRGSGCGPRVPAQDQGQEQQEDARERPDQYDFLRVHENESTTSEPPTRRMDEKSARITKRLSVRKGCCMLWA